MEGNVRRPIWPLIFSAAIHAMLGLALWKAGFLTSNTGKSVKGPVREKIISISLQEKTKPDVSPVKSKSNSRKIKPPAATPPTEPSLPPPPQANLLARQTPVLIRPDGDEPAYKGSDWVSPISEAVREDGGCICIQGDSKTCFKPPLTDPATNCDGSLVKVNVTERQNDRFLSGLVQSGIAVDALIAQGKMYATMKSDRAFGEEALKAYADSCGVHLVTSYRLRMIDGKPHPYQMVPSGKCADEKE